MERATQSQSAPSVVKADQADVHVSQDTENHADTVISGDKVTFNESDTDRTNVTGTWRADEDNRVRGLIADALTNREKRENERANHRNKNRLLTLAGAIVIGIIVTYFFQNDGFPILGAHHVLPKALAMTLYGYSFVVTVTLDASLALYSYIKKY